jgi:acetoin utilization deacetylase AcuC-like enzyme
VQGRAAPGQTRRQALKFVTDPVYGDHLRGMPHPERPERVEVVAARLRALGVMREELAARDATDEELLRVHTPEYLALVERVAASLPAGGDHRELPTGDTLVGANSLRVARRAAGGAIVAAEAAIAGDQAVFALVRPPGHHAEPDRGMGFCIFNNAAIAARASGLASVLVADFDYHHGNGTQAVAGRGLSYVSTHAYPAYPGTGTQSCFDRDRVVANVPLPASGVSTQRFVETWEELLPRVAERVKPELLVVSAGFDYVAGDPVGDLGVGVESAERLAALLGRVAERHCRGRIAYVLEGGYDLDALTESIALIASQHAGSKRSLKLSDT